jgi:hypothetical protein
VIAVDPHERATSVWYSVAGLLRRKDLAIEIIEGEIRSAQHEMLLEASKLGADRRADRDRAATARARGADDPAEVLSYGARGGCRCLAFDPGGSEDRVKRPHAEDGERRASRFSGPRS